MDTFPAVEIENLSFTYGCHPVLKDINLTITAGEAVGITGPNGSGKTTLIRLMVGQLQPGSGGIRLFGADVSGGRWRSRVTYVPQKATFFNQGFPATVMEIVLSGRTGRRGLFRGFAREDFQWAEKALETMEIHSLRDNPISSLSGGQQQRVFIARALAAGPDLLIMDEPTVGVDAATSQKLYSILRKANREKNLTLVIVSHDMEGLAGLITRQVCLNLHLCTCNSWKASPEQAVAQCRTSLLPVYPGGRV